MKVFKATVLISILAIVFFGLNVIYKKKSFNYQEKGVHMKLTTDFEHNGNIPSIYTCDGEDLAPVLNISEIPANTQELALIVDDPDAPVGTWVHWILYNIPANTTKIDNKNLTPEIKQGMTDFKRIGWGGPCPPNGEHRYFFKLYALDKKLDLPIGSTKKDLEKAMNEHIIEKVEIIGLYNRTQ